MSYSSALLLCSVHLYILRFFYRIKNIPATAFQDLHSLEWIKLYNNLLTTLHYELMEPVLDTLQHIDIHSKYTQTLDCCSLKALKKYWMRKLHLLNWMNCSTYKTKEGRKYSCQAGSLPLHN